LALSGALFVGGLTFATNGDILIGVGPVSRAMGGVGIGLYTDADSVIFSNPALMTEPKTNVFSFGGTLFMPHTKAYEKSLLNGGVASSATSNAKYFAIPSIGIIYHINKKITFGISAYGISGMGVDYRNTNISCNPYNTLAQVNATGAVIASNPQGCYTNFQGMEMAPSIAVKVNNQLSLGFGVDLLYGALDLGHGLSSDYALSFQGGIAYKVTPMITIGAVIKTPSKFNFPRVMYNPKTGRLEDLTLEQPWQYGVGIGIKPNDRIRIGADVQYLQWSKADGYKDFDWKDQWVFKIGGEYKVNDILTLRAGYNYGKSPIRGHKVTNPYDDKKGDGAECMRIIGFPAIVESHITVGAGIKLTKDMALNISYMHAFENTVKSTSVDGSYWKSKLSEDAISMGLTWNF
jgi:long-chain fatty acid transport protein